MSNAQKEFIRQVLLETRVFKALRSTVHEVLATVPNAIMASRNLGAAAELVASAPSTVSSIGPVSQMW